MGDRSVGTCLAGGPEGYTHVLKLELLCRNRCQNHPGIGGQIPFQFVWFLLSYSGKSFFFPLLHKSMMLIGLQYTAAYAY